MSDTPTEAQPDLAAQLIAMRHKRNEWRCSFYVLLVGILLMIGVAGYLHASGGSSEVQSPASYVGKVRVCGTSQMSAPGATGYLTTHGFIVIPDSLARTPFPAGTALNVTYQNVVTGPWAGYFMATRLSAPTSTGVIPDCKQPALQRV